MKKLVWLLLVVSSSICLSTAEDDDETDAINYVTKDGKVHEGVAKKGIFESNHYIAWARFENTINKTGWSQLEVHTNPNATDSEQAYYAGYLEGYLTHELISLYWKNTLTDYCDGHQDYCERLYTFIEKNMNFIQKQVQEKRDKDNYWNQVGLIYEQVTGVQDGFKIGGSNGSAFSLALIKPRIEIDPKSVILLNLSPELGALENVLGRENKTYSSGDDHCSVIVKVLPGGKDMYVSHNTWISYSTMIRVLKNYNLNFHKSTPGNKTTLSSYPGVIHSIDDFNIVGSGLVVLETSISNHNEELWKFAGHEDSVAEFVRSLVSNRLARNGQEWTEIFVKYNSGTYNNQWMVVDYNRFVPGTEPSKLSSDILWIVEQMPKFTMAGDVTDIIRRQSYWPSYNIPYFPFIYEKSGTDKMAEKHGDLYSYFSSPRARIFRRDQNKVMDMKGLFQLMSYNDFKNDPLSRCNCTPPYSANYAIAARGDLNDPNGTYPLPFMGFFAGGATDVKMVNRDLIKSMQMIAISGPSYQQQPEFEWSKSKIVNPKNEGQPDKWNFSPVHVKWLPSKTQQTNID